MADASFPLEFVTPTGGVQRIRCDGIVVALADGEAGILKGHAPMMAAIPAGIVRVRSGETEERYAVGEAFLQVSQKGAAIFTTKCEKQE